MATHDEMRTKILEVAIRYIEEHGESSLRLRTIAAKVGIALPTLYHYFENREALVTAAYAERYRADLSQTLDPFLAAVEVCTNRNEFIDAFENLYRNSFPKLRSGVRAHRAETIGRALHDPVLQESIVETMRETIIPGVEGLELAKSKGWIPSDLDPEAFALWNLAHISSLIVTEVLDDDSLLLRIQDLMMTAALSLLALDPLAPASDEAK